MSEVETQYKILLKDVVNGELSIPSLGITPNIDPLALLGVVVCFQFPLSGSLKRSQAVSAGLSEV